MDGLNRTWSRPVSESEARSQTKVGASKTAPGGGSACEWGRRNVDGALFGVNRPAPAHQTYHLRYRD
jgi:hypothetical protein